MVVAEVVELERVRSPAIPLPPVAPVTESTPLLDRDRLPPRLNDPPPLRPLPVLIVTLEF